MLTTKSGAAATEMQPVITLSLSWTTFPTLPSSTPVIPLTSQAGALISPSCQCWQLYPTTASDHFAVVTTLAMQILSPIPRPLRLSLNKADWHQFRLCAATTLALTSCPLDSDEAEERFVRVLHVSANEAIPFFLGYTNRHKDR